MRTRPPAAPCGLGAEDGPRTTTTWCPRPPMRTAFAAWPASVTGRPPRRRSATPSPVNGSAYRAPRAPVPRAPPERTPRSPVGGARRPWPAEVGRPTLSTTSTRRPPAPATSPGADRSLPAGPAPGRAAGDRPHTTRPARSTGLAVAPPVHPGAARRPPRRAPPGSPAPCPSPSSRKETDASSDR